MQLQNYDGCTESFKTEEHTRLYSDQVSLNNTGTASVSATDGKTLNTEDQTEFHELEQSFEGDRLLKPSRIPILKTKHLESTNSISNNDLSNKCTNPSVQDYELAKVLNVSSIPTSPVTGKKYRSPLTIQAKLSDRSKKTVNGNVSNNNTLCDNVMPANTANSNLVINSNMDNQDVNLKTVSNETSVNMNSPVLVTNETNSGRSTPVSSNNKFQNEVMNCNIDKYKGTGTSELLNLEKKPRFKWMFGPHKNANVVRYYFL